MSPGPFITADHRARERALQRSGAKSQCLLPCLVIILTLLFAGPALSWASLDHAVTPHLPVHSASAPLAGVPVSPSAQPVSSSGQPSPLLIPSLVLAAIGLWGILRRRRSPAAVALTLLLGFFAFETAFHSVHHFSDPQKGAHCPVFSASQHVTGASTGHSTLSTPTLAAEPAPSGGPKSILPSRLFNPDQGRAPPSLLA